MIACPIKNNQEWKDLVAKVGLDEAYGIWNESKGEIQYDPEEAKTVISKLTDVLLKQKAIFSKKANSKKFIADIDHLLNLISQEGKELESLLEFIADSNVYINQLYDRFSELQEQLDRSEYLTPKERNDALNLINKIKELSSSYNMLDELDLLLNDSKSSPIGPDQEVLSRTIRRRNKLKSEYEEAGKNLVADWLYQEAIDINEKLQEEGKSKYILSKDKIKDELEQASKDISFFTAMFGSAISSADPITALAAKAIKLKMTEANTEDLDIKEELVAAYEKSGEPSIEENKKYIHEINHVTYQVVDGKSVKVVTKAKAFITRYDTSKFEEAKSEFFEKIGKKPEDPKKAKEWSKAVSIWFKDNMSIKSNAHQIVKDKRRELSPEDFDAWFKENTIATDNTKYKDGRSKLNMIKAENPASVAATSDNGRTIYLFSGELVRPNDKYVNPEYNNFQNDSYYHKLLDTYNRANDKLPTAYRLKHGMLPQVAKGSDQKSLSDRFSKANLKEQFNVQAHDRKYKLQTLSGEEYKQVPIAYTGKIDESLVSMDLLESVLRFSQMSTNYQKMSEIKANIDMLMSLVNDRSVVETNSRGEGMVDAVTKKLRLKSASEAKKVNERLKNFIDMAFYGQEEHLSTIVFNDKEYNVNKIAGKLQYLTALSSMAFNVTSGINNVVWGNYQAIAQSTGGKNYTKAGWLKALGQYTANIPLYMNDLSKRIGKSKDNQLVEIFDAIQGEFKDEYGNKVSGSTARRLFNTNSLFFTNNAGEHQIQVTSMIALLQHHKVKLRAGGEISIYDAYELNGHRYELRSDVVFSDRDKFNIMNEIHAINKKLHGTYNDFDKPEIQRFWYGKMALMFRKHIYTGIKNRYGKEQLNVESRDVEEGYYRTFMSKLSSDVKEFGLSGVANYKNYTPEQRVAFKKTMKDVTLFIGALLLAGAISGDDKDKDKSWFQDEMTLQLRRFSSDINFYTFLTKDTWRILNNPTVTQNTVSHITDFVDQLVTGPLDVYERNTGIFSKGDSKLGAKFVKMMPIIRQVNSLLTPSDQLKIFNR